MTAKKPGKTILVVMAHPDDADFSSGGTIAKWVQEGHRVYYVLATLGDKGSSDPEMTSEKLAAIRLAEQKNAAAVLGVQEVIFLGERDGELENSVTLREKIVKVIRQYKPQTVLTFDPTVYIRESFWGKYSYINHSDHRVMGIATLDAVYPSARDYLYFPHHRREGLEPHKVLEIYLANPEKPNTWIDIRPTLGLKVEALSRHQSQLGADINTPERQKEFRQMLSRNARRSGQGHRLKYAEAFRKLVLRA